MKKILPVLFCIGLLLTACNMPATDTAAPSPSPSPDANIAQGSGSIRISGVKDLYQESEGNQPGVMVRIEFDAQGVDISEIPFQIKTNRGYVMIFAGQDTPIPGYTQKDFKNIEIFFNGKACTGNRRFTCPLQE